jgi:hypothetical protein
MFRVHILVRFFAVKPQKMRPIFQKIFVMVNCRALASRGAATRLKPGLPGWL